MKASLSQKSRRASKNSLDESWHALFSAGTLWVAIFSGFRCPIALRGRYGAFWMRYLVQKVRRAAFHTLTAVIRPATPTRVMALLML